MAFVRGGGGATITSTGVRGELSTTSDFSKGGAAIAAERSVTV
jgi:hypothetical protein